MPVNPRGRPVRKRPGFPSGVPAGFVANGLGKATAIISRIIQDAQRDAEVLMPNWPEIQALLSHNPECPEECLLVFAELCEQTGVECRNEAETVEVLTRLRSAVSVRANHYEKDRRRA